MGMTGDAVRQRLAEISARADAATPAAWFEASRDGDDETWWLWAIENDGQPIPIAKFVVRENDEEDARLAASSRSDLPRLVAALTGTPEKPGVLDLHFSVKRRASVVSPDPSGYLDVCSHCSAIGDASLAIAWPCPTYRAVAAALEEQP